MTIETKFNIGDEVWVKDFSKAKFATPFCTKIKAITIFGREEDDIFYKCSIDANNTITIEECALFPTKEELLKSL